MAFNETKIGDLIERDEGTAAGSLLALITKARGNLVHAALYAGVHHSTVKRWIAKLEANGWLIRDAIEDVRRRSQPRKLTKAAKAAFEQKAATKRRMNGLSRVLKSLDEDQRKELARAASVRLSALSYWAKRDWAFCTDAEAARIEAQLTILRNTKLATNRRQYRARAEAELG